MSHLYIPLGWNCSAARKLNQYGKRHVSYPFDWLAFQTYDSYCSLLDDGFTNAFNNVHIGPLEYSVPSLPGKQLKSVWDFDYNFLSVHDYYTGIPDISEIRNKLQNRYLKLVEDLSSATEVTLHVELPTDSLKAEGFTFYTQRLGIDLTDHVTYNNTLADVVSRFESLAPYAIVNTVETTLTEM